MTLRIDRRHLVSTASAVVIVGVVAATAALSAGATPGISSAFAAKYPGNTLSARTLAATGNACFVCHQPPNTSMQGNCYKTAIAARLDAGLTNAQAMDDLDQVDSDGDGVTNGDEVRLARADMPGQVGYNPGLIGATGTDPCASDTSTPVTGQRETPPPACRADFDGDGTVDFFDYDAFVNCFEGLFCPPGKTADFDGDGSVDFFDYDAFVVAFETGC
ncbi:MAG: hypothetical protein AABZ53_17325 [Planctomycetota bacterium]